MDTQETTEDRIRIVIETDRPGRFVGRPNLMDKLRQTVINMTEVEDVWVLVNQTEKSNSSN